jgi:hypothetical protein
MKYIILSTSGSMLAEQALINPALYHLCHSSCYFGDGGLMNYLPGLALNYNPPDLSLSSS